MLARPYDDPRALIIVNAIRTKHNVWGWLIVLTILVINWIIMDSDYDMMRAAAYEKIDYQVTDYVVEETEDSYIIEIRVENHSAEECWPMITAIENADGQTMDLLDLPRANRFKSITDNGNRGVAIPAQARGAARFELSKSVISGHEGVTVTFDNLDQQELEILLPSA